MKTITLDDNQITVLINSLNLTLHTSSVYLESSKKKHPNDVSFYQNEVNTITAILNKLNDC